MLALLSILFSCRLMVTPGATHLPPIKRSSSSFSRGFTTIYTTSKPSATFLPASHHRRSTGRDHYLGTRAGLYPQSNSKLCAAPNTATFACTSMRDSILYRPKLTPTPTILRLQQQQVNTSLAHYTKKSHALAAVCPICDKTSILEASATRGQYNM